jgi:S-adenosylmethionine synthetase
MGEVTVNGNVGDIQDIVRKTVADIGYTGGKLYFMPKAVASSWHCTVSPRHCHGRRQGARSQNGRND